MKDRINTSSILNILMLEDSVMDFEIICNKLSYAGYNLNSTRVEKENEFASLLRSNKYDIILADFNLPGFNAFGALRLCNNICPDVPFICVSGAIGEETAIELLKSGAVDYVMKDKLERLSIAVKRALDEAKEREERKRVEQNYRTLFNEMLNGLAIHEIICNERGEPVDYRFLAVNPAFEKTVERKAEELIGRTALEMLPGTEQIWIETYGRVALTGEPAHFEGYSSELKKHFEVTAFQSAPDQFACIFSDISVRKQAEEELNIKMKEMQRFYNLTIDRELSMIELKKEVNALLKQAGNKEKYRIVE